MHYRITQVRILPPKVIELSIIFGSWIRRGESKISFLFLLGDEMDRQNLYNIYQNNLELLENELGQVKKMTQINLGKLYYVILSILVDTFISKISLPMQPVPEIRSISGA